MFHTQATLPHSRPVSIFGVLFSVAIAVAVLGLALALPNAIFSGPAWGEIPAATAQQSVGDQPANPIAAPVAAYDTGVPSAAEVFRGRPGVPEEEPAPTF